MNGKRVGVGINYRVEFEAAILGHIEAFDFLEFVTDALFEPGRLTDGTRRALGTKPFALHGLRTSLGSAEALDRRYAARTLEVVGRLKPLWFSDHIAFTQIAGIQVGRLLPVRRTEENAQRIIEKIRFLKGRCDTPYLVENIAYYFEYDDDPLTEPAFISQILEGADCGLLLDVANLYVNSVNFGFDPHRFAASLPLERVTEIHLAGSLEREKVLIDTHGHQIPDAVWDLLEFICRRARPLGIIIERDTDFDIQEILESVQRAQSIFLSASD